MRRGTPAIVVLLEAKTILSRNFSHSITAFMAAEINERRKTTTVRVRSDMDARTFHFIIFKSS